MKTVLSVLAAVAITLVAQNTFISNKSTEQTSAQPAYDRVMKTNTLRCAYAIYPQFVNKDPNTGELSGFFPEVMKEIEKISGLKVEWTDEIDYGSIATTLQSGRADAFCAGVGLTPTRGRVITGSTPLSYAIMGAYVRTGDTRFDNASDKINESSVKIEANTGDFSEEIAKRFYPKAQIVYRGTMGGEDQLFLDVAMKKADITFSGPNNLAVFNKNNPLQQLRLVPFNNPVYRLPVVIGLEIHEEALKSLLDASVHDLIDNGVIEKLLQKNTGEFFGTGFAAPQRRM